MFTLKRCSSAMALVVASSIPALAQDAEIVTLAVPEGFVAAEGSVVLQFAGTDALYVVPYDVAAELCRVTEGDFAAVAESGVDVIYCQQLDEAELVSLAETEGVETLLDRRRGGGDDTPESADDDIAGEDGDDLDDGAGDDIDEDGAGDGADVDGSDDDGTDADVEAGAEVEANTGG